MVVRPRRGPVDSVCSVKSDAEQSLVITGSPSLNRPCPKAIFSWDDLVIADQ